MHAADQLERMNAQELREFAARLITELTDTRREVSLKQHDTGNALKMDKDGNTAVSTKKALTEAIGEDHSPDVEGKQTVKVKGVVRYSGSIIHLNPP